MSEAERLAERMRAVTHDYVSRADCGCVVAIASDLKDKWTARFVADEIRQGHTIERLPVADAVAALRAACDGSGLCPQCKAALEAKRARAAQGTLFSEATP